VDYLRHFEEMLSHYVRMAETCPAWKRYAWDRVNELATECPELYADLPRRLTLAMTVPAESSPPSSGSGSTSRTRPA
jgi:hypothetical protein